MEFVKNIAQTKIIKFVFLALIGSLILAISSKVKIPFYPVPMTMQTMIVLLIGITFGWRLGLATIALYLLEGIIGLPVFAGTPEKGIGIIYFTGPTMGYLLGFLPAVFFSGYLKINNRNNFLVKFVLNFVIFTFSVSFIYIFGLIWLLNFVPFNKVFALGALPFLPAELFKILILTVFATLMNKSNLSWRSFR